jgi:hypothetical protein
MSELDSDEESNEESDEDFVTINATGTKKYEKDELDEATSRVKRDVRGRGQRVANAGKDCEHVEVVDVVGAVQVPGFEMMYLLHYTEKKWQGHSQERQWTTTKDMSSLDLDSLARLKRVILREQGYMYMCTCGGERNLQRQSRPFNFNGELGRKVDGSEYNVHVYKL